MGSKIYPEESKYQESFANAETQVEEIFWITR
jgi:hypothetical protein